MEASIKEVVVVPRTGKIRDLIECHSSFKFSEDEILNSLENLPKGNQLVALRRGEKWKKSLLGGKLGKACKPSALRILRVKMGISQTKFSAHLKISLASYGSFERGQRAVKFAYAHFIADYFLVPISTLFVEIDNCFYAKEAD